MPDELAFIRAIQADPDADGPRLVYADWLEEQGDAPRAEFIRVQIELARYGPRGVPRTERDERWIRLHDREQALEKRYGRRWSRRLGAFVKGTTFTRGMVEWVAMTASDFVRFGARVFERAPVSKMGLIGAGPVMGRLAASATLRNLRALSLVGGEITAERMQELDKSPHIAGLQSLDLSRNPLGDLGATVLGLSRSLPNLKYLQLGWCDIGTVGLGALSNARAHNFPELQTLRIQHNRFDLLGLEMLLQGDLAPQLHELDITQNSLSAAGARLLSRSGRLTHLSDLSMGWNRIGDAGASAIANASELGGLEVLQLWNCDIGRSGARALAQSRHLGGLKRLMIGGNRFDDATGQLLKRRFGKRLDLG